MMQSVLRFPPPQVAPAREADFADLCQDAPCGLCAQDRSGILIASNDRLLQWVGLPGDEVVGRARIADFCDEQDRDGLVRAFAQLPDVGHLDGLRFRLLARDGSRRDVRLWANVHYSNDGGLLFTRAALVDVSDDSPIERELKDRQRELAIARDDLKSVSYSMSHDLRAPLRAINSLAAILIEDHGRELSPVAHELVTRIRGAGRRMGRLLDALLVLIRLEASEAPTAQFAHEPLVDDALKALLEKLGGVAPRIIVGPLPRCTGHPGLVREVWYQLLSNALKYTGSGGEIEVGCDRTGSLPVYFVRDTGCGFDMRFANRLFRAFEQPRIDDAAPGNGIGLAIVHHVVGRHGGRVWATSSIGQGATFFFTLEPDPSEPST